MTGRLLTLREVVARVALGRTALYETVRRGEFPAPIKLSATRNAWVASEVDGWIERLVTRLAQIDPARASGRPSRSLRDPPPSA